MQSLRPPGCSDNPFLIWPFSSSFYPFQSKIQSRGGDQVVIVLAFFFYDPSSNPALAYSFFVKFVLEKNENKLKSELAQFFKIADGWIRTHILRSQRRPYCQLCHNHCPSQPSMFVVIFPLQIFSARHELTFFIRLKLAAPGRGY